MSARQLLSFIINLISIVSSFLKGFSSLNKGGLSPKTHLLRGEPFWFVLENFGLSVNGDFLEFVNIKLIHIMLHNSSK